MPKRVLLASTILAGALSTAFGAFGIFQIGNPLPAGVTLIQPDGGTTYYASNGFTVASASRTFPASGTVYSHGLDDPGWFLIGPFQTNYGGAGDPNGVARHAALGLNTLVLPDANQYYSGMLDLAQTNGVAVMGYHPQLGHSISVDRLPGSETVIIGMMDEPFQTLQAITAAVTGLPQVNFTGNIPSSSVNLTASALSSNNLISNLTSFAYSPATLTGSSLPANTFITGNNAATGSAGVYQTTATGPFSGPMSQAAVAPLTMSILNGRPIYTNFTNAIYSQVTPLGTGGGPPFTPAVASDPIAGVLSTNHLAVDGTTNRHIDLTGIDFYFIPMAYSANGTFGGNNWNLTATGIYDPTHGGGNMSVANQAKGSHQGDLIDFMRQIQANNGQPAPIFDNIATGNAFFPGLGYTTQPQELNWNMWSHIIHGGRGILLFTHDNGWFNGGNDNLVAASSATIQTASITATATTGPNVLAVTATASGFLAPGMVSTSGISGQIQVLQQTNNFTSGSGNVAANYSFNVLSGAGTSAGSVPMTFAQPTVAPNVTSNKNTSAATVSGAVLTFSSTTGVFPGMGVTDLSNSVIPANTSILSVTSTTATMSANVTGGGVLNGDNIQFSAGGTILGQLQSTDALISTLAPVINSPFAKGFATSSNTGYSFELGPGGQPCSSGGTMQTAACAVNTGIDFMVKYYTGGTYSTSGYNISTDSITNGFYIFATTRNTELTVNSSVTFTVPSVSAVRVVNENRNISPASGTTFTDTFANAWTVHIYKVTP